MSRCHDRRIGWRCGIERGRGRRASGSGSSSSSVRSRLAVLVPRVVAAAEQPYGCSRLVTCGRVPEILHDLVPTVR